MAGAISISFRFAISDALRLRILSACAEKKENAPAGLDRLLSGVSKLPASEAAAAAAGGAVACAGIRSFLAKEVLQKAGAPESVPAEDLALLQLRAPGVFKRLPTDVAVKGALEEHLRLESRGHALVCDALFFLALERGEKAPDDASLGADPRFAPIIGLMREELRDEHTAQAAAASAVAPDAAPAAAAAPRRGRRDGQPKRPRKEKMDKRRYVEAYGTATFFGGDEAAYLKSYEGELSSIVPRTVFIAARPLLEDIKLFEHLIQYARSTAVLEMMEIIYGLTTDRESALSSISKAAAARLCIHIIYAEKYVIPRLQTYFPGGLADLKAMYEKNREKIAAVAEKNTARKQEQASTISASATRGAAGSSSSSSSEEGEAHAGPAPSNSAPPPEPAPGALGSDAQASSSGPNAGLQMAPTSAASTGHGKRSKRAPGDPAAAKGAPAASGRSGTPIATGRPQRSMSGTTGYHMITDSYATTVFFNGDKTAFLRSYKGQITIEIARSIFRTARTLLEEVKSLSSYMKPFLERMDLMYELAAKQRESASVDKATATRLLLDVKYMDEHVIPRLQSYFPGGLPELKAMYEKNRKKIAAAAEKNTARRQELAAKRSRAIDLQNSSSNTAAMQMENGAQDRNPNGETYAWISSSSSSSSDEGELEAGTGARARAAPSNSAPRPLPPAPPSNSAPPPARAPDAGALGSAGRRHASSSSPNAGPGAAPAVGPGTDQGQRSRSKRARTDVSGRGAAAHGGGACAPPPAVASASWSGPGPSLWDRYQEVTTKVSEQRLAITTAMIQAGNVDLAMITQLIREYVRSTFGGEFWDEATMGLKPWSAVAAAAGQPRGQAMV